MSVDLTQGAIEALFSQSHINNPVLQVLKIREIVGSQGPSKYRLALSDGVHMSPWFVVVTELSHLVESKQLSPGCVCMLKKTNKSYLSNKKLVLVVLDMDVLQSAEETGGTIGNPSQLNDSATSGRQVSDVSSSDTEAASMSGDTQGASASSMRGLMENSPMKMSPMKMSPMKASPMKVSPLKASPMKASPMKASPMKSPMKVIPIENLNPYVSNWTVRARVTSKSNIRHWSNSRGEGSVFSFEVVDQSGEIKVTAFNNEVDKFFPLVEPNQVYLISKGSLKVANKQYNTLNNNYEMTLNANSLIVPCQDGQGVPTVRCDFVPISQLENTHADTIVDVIGVCEEVGDVAVINTKAGRQTQKRELTLTDSSGKRVTLTLWGDEAQKFEVLSNPVVAIKGARLSDFGGRSLSAVFSSTLMVNPDVPEAVTLRAWYNQVGHSLHSQSLTELRSMGGEARTNWKSLSDIKTELMGHSETADYCSCVATVLFIRKENCLYRACPSASCNKKVVERDGRYHCQKCDKDFPDFKYRFILSVNLADFEDNQWVTCFQETAEALLGVSADALGCLRDTDEDAFQEVLRKVTHTTHVFRTRVKLETYNDESRVKVTVLEVLPLDHRQYSRRLLANIRTLSCRT
ncbi:replication protein A 70 kDa DNA-binding subunit-like isoform X2 [Entelurus aequoreus]|uniref:replication protein A 70 kDa DNA-binding subunit-like isoform X2 n=1 Tax=Entelurus aequoreus TaxID=161455 RepID=UPI002B1E039D|nr:replication protein A 70 kDa DNA-binding subunit-like isoform X2 [Entelurus aequoreus]